MKHQLLTERQKEYIETNFNRMYISEMAMHLKSTAQIVKQFMDSKGLIQRKRRQPRIRESVIPEGCFNVKPSKLPDFNWLV